MIIKIRFYGDLAREYGKIQEQVNVSEPVTVENILSRVLFRKKINLRDILNDHAIIINGKKVSINEIINESCEIRIIPLVKGGTQQSPMY